MKQNIQPHPPESDVIDDSDLLKADVSTSVIHWWESKRLWFNFLVGVAGILGIYANISYLSTLDAIGIIFWGVLANLLYSIGMTVELLNGYYFKNSYNLIRFRWLFFVVGCVSYSALTYWYSVTYFLKTFND